MVVQRLAWLIYGVWFKFQLGSLCMELVILNLWLNIFIGYIVILNVSITISPEYHSLHSQIVLSLIGTLQPLVFIVFPQISVYCKNCDP